MEYVHNLCYDDPKVPREKNNFILEGEVQGLSFENQKVLEQLPNCIPPVILKYNQQWGYFVEAAIDIPALTLICEYTG